MAILTQDIKILKSAVMNDSTDGGGRMTGVPVVDGQSNSLFPDTSAMDRAFGRVQMRKVFGVAHTNDTDTLMGAHAIITDTPDDENVHCTLMKTTNWGDQRNSAKELIERYLVKGPRSSWRIYDTHYEGSARLRLYAFSNLQPPVSGESLCLINPNGQELYVRILRVKAFTEKVYLQEGSGTVEANASFIECDLGQTLVMDVYGPPIVRTGLNETQYAMVYSTVLATGVKFYGTKALGFEGKVGDFNVETDDGIFTPLVPAATVETAVVDQYPLIDRVGFVNTGYGTIDTINGDDSNKLVYTYGQTITLPTPVAPKTLRVLTWIATELCKDVGDGEIKNSGGTLVARIDYATGIITFVQKSAVGGNPLYFQYTPASRAGAALKTDAIEVTTINQGLAFTINLVPIPAPSTLTIDYMAQGRWYTLVDNGTGKLSGGDTAYGTATVNYTTGSVVMTLGAIPDVGSFIIFNFGASGTAVAPAVETLPTRFSTDIDLGANRISLASVKFTPLNASGNPQDTITLDAAGKASIGECVVTGNGKFRYTYPQFLAKKIRVEWQEYGDARTAVITPELPGGSGISNTFTLTDSPVIPRTVSFQVALTPPNNHRLQAGSTQPTTVRDNGAGKLILPRWSQVDAEVGTIDYTTGVVTLNTVNLLTIETYSVAVKRYSSGGNIETPFTNTFSWDSITSYRNSSADVSLTTRLETVKYSGEMGDVKTLDVVTNQWYLQLPTNLQTTGLALTLAGQLLTAKNGTLFKDWNYANGAATAVGTVANNGLVTIEAQHQTNAITWLNAAVTTTGDSVTAGIFRTANAPLKQGIFQLIDSSNRALQVNVDYQRGIVRWTVPGAVEGYSPWYVQASTLRYNAVYLEYLPLEASILGLNTARLPLDGKVPVYRSGDLCVVHNTLTLELPNPLVKGSAYTMRERLASVRVKDALGVVVPDTKYELDLNAGTITFPVGISITSYAQPFTVEHRIEDLLLCSQADISGRLRFTRSLTHNFPANTSFVSSALPFGDLFARFYNVVEQQTWTNEWSDRRIGGAMTANFNETDYPIQVTNRGTIKERWAVIFTGSTTFRVVGESVGEIGYGNTSDDCAPTNNATSAPYFVIPALGWGAGWSVGNVLRFNTDACGAPFWIVRTILQGPASVESDKFALAFRGDVDRP
jgi:hypothetical protein